MYYMAPSNEIFWLDDANGEHILPAGSAQITEEAALSNIPQPTISDIQLLIVSSVQARLDTFAQTRNYDGILSACTYATSTVPKFAADGQAAVDLRDATWQAMYAFLAEVLAGTKPMPTGYADVEPLLPVLEWPQ